MLTEAQEEHLIRVREYASARIEGKYRHGAQEHGGDIRQQTMLELVDNALDEAIDGVVYLITARDKILDKGGF